YLKDLMDRLRKEIHAFDGVVDRVLGDGLLAFFGYHYDGRKAYDNHASQALACAVSIQRNNVQACLDAPEDTPIFPLRIGINTDSVYFGNLGDSSGIDVTLIGSGVNLA